MTTGDQKVEIHEIMRTRFGFDTFLQGQQAIIEDVLSGQPTIAVMPTGAGKSLCYQLPALLCPGPTVVVSPLISLMKDQVDGLKAKGIRANFINSTQSRAEQDEVLEALEPGKPSLLYVAPERFRNARFNGRLAQLEVALFAIDEAHCISRWGHDFRPDYARLGRVVDQLKPQRLLACTATATPQVKTDIVQVLGMASPQVHAAGFLRKNLFLRAQACHGEADRTTALQAFLTPYKSMTGAVIVYASTRKRVTRYSDLLRTLFEPRDVVSYHGGLDDEARTMAQEAFMSGRARFAVATNAFGMGIDRADVRAVVHVDLPRTIEGYYQEVGRAGRDGEPAHCLLLHHPKDLQTHVFLIEMSYPEPNVFASVWGALRGEGAMALSVDELCQLCPRDTHPGKVESVLRTLKTCDAAYPLGMGGEWQAHPSAPRDLNALGIDFGAMKARRLGELAKLESMRVFAFHRRCRHQNLLDYFGEHTPIDACPGCDRCTRATEDVENPLTDEEITMVRQALAGVARARGIFGLKRVAGMLAGSKMRGVADTPALASLSTYGLLAPFGVEGCTLLLKTLVAEGLCELTGSRYPMLCINEEGWAVMQGRSDVRSAMPSWPAAIRPAAKRSTHAAATAAATAAVAEGPLADALRSFRREEAARRNAPAFVVFTDRTLGALVANPPKNRTEFEAIVGLGPGKWSNFGPALIEAVEAHHS